MRGRGRSIVRFAALALLAAVGLSRPGAARAQFGVQTTTAPPVSQLGLPVSLERGPWVLGEVLFFSAGRVVTDYTWRDRVRGRRGVLYTKADVLSDVESLKGLEKFTKVDPALYEIANSPVPPEFATIAVSTNQVRLIFTVVEIAASTSAATTAAKSRIPPAAISGVVLTPTAYRGAGRYATPGLGLDINAMYMIGRLYGKNTFANTIRKTNYIDRIGVWLLTGDGKMQIQSEGDWRPAMAVGGQGTMLFRDSPQPKVNDPNPTVTVNATQKSTKLLSDAYFVASKKFGPLRTSLGFMQGSHGDMIAHFSEFMTPDGLSFYAGRPGSRASSRSVPFASLLLLPKPQYPLAVEVMKFNGAPLNPIMINFKIGYFLKMNFDIAVLKFDGGYDVMGLLQFRYNHFPRR